MRTARVVFLFLTTAATGCGGFLGFGDDAVDPPPPNATSDAGPDASSVSDASGAADGSDDAADLADVSIVIPPLDAAVDSNADQLFPRLATFENGTVDGTAGADVNNGMTLLVGNGLKGSYSAQAKSASASIGFTFASKPTDEIYAAFLFRFDELPAAQTPAVFFALSLAGGDNVAAAVQSDGDVFVVVDGKATKVDTIPLGAVRRFGLHARTNPATLQAVVVPDGPFTGVVPVNVLWPAPAAITAASLGELSGGSMIVTVDQVAFRQDGFEK